ncbi:ATP-grasp domain-containing protein [Elusimicrobiota bacterium]
MVKNVIFIESNTTGTGEIFAQLSSELGYKPSLIVSDPDKYSSVFKTAAEILVAQTNNTDEVLEMCRNLSRQRELAGITSSSEYYMYTAAVIARMLKLQGPDPEAINRTRNKYIQRETLRKNNMPVPGYMRAHNSEEAVMAAEKIGYPVVVKPVLASGSEGVRLCGISQEVRSHAEELLKIKMNPRGQLNPDYILVEEYMKGEEYSVEAFSKNGSINIIGITKKYLGEKPAFMEVAHDFPARLDENREKELTDAVVLALNIIGLDWGPTHTEVKLTGEGPRIIEINPRLAGGMIPKLIKYSKGIDMILNTLKLVCGDEVDLEDQKKEENVSIRFLVPAENGRVIGVNGIEEAGQIDNIEEIEIYEKKLEKFTHLKGDFNDRLGHVIARGDSNTQCHMALSKAVNKISFLIE